MSSSPNSPNLSVSRKAVVASSFGNALEWYDFTVYAFFATYIAATFFQDGDDTQAMISTFLAFGVGFVARPVGSLVLGVFADRRGRKPALMLSLFTMALGVLVIAVTPSAATIGLAAPVLLLFGRLLQGFSAGGELGSAASYLVEHAPADRRSGYAAWLQASMGISNLLSAIAGLLVTSFFTESEILEWAWRLPFFAGLLLIPVGLYIRRQLPETAEFEAEAGTRSIGEMFGVLFREHWQALVAGFGFCVLWNGAVASVIVFGPTYYRISGGLGFSSQQTFLASFVGNIFFVVTCLVSGRLADRLGRRTVLTIAAVALAVVPVVMLWLVHSVSTVPVVLVVHSALCVCVALFVGVAPSTLPMAFAPEVRSSGVSITYNLAAICFAGFVPAWLTWADRAVSVFSPALLMAGCAVLTLACIPWLFREIHAVEMHSAN